jgi:CheY-like chemotaxis protein
MFEILKRVQRASRFHSAWTPRQQACSYGNGGANPAMRVLIADDHRVIRKSISSILQSRKDIQVCGQAVNGQEAVSKAQLLKPDLLILDISLPDSSGLEVATAIKIESGQNEAIDNL